MNVIGFFLLTAIAFFSGLSSNETINHSENQSMELIGHKLIGSGKEKVLVMHHWLSDSSSYDPLLPYLDTENFTYLLVDLRGYGRSKGLRGKYTVEEASSDAIRLVNSLSWDKFHVIGHSMSGMIAQKIALDNFSRVKSVVAITPVPACGSPGPEETMVFLEKAALDNVDNAIGCVHMLTSGRYTNLFAKNMVNYWHNCSIGEARVGYLNMFSNTDFSTSVNGLTTPMLVIYCEHDMEGIEAFMQNTFQKWYPNAKLECCKGSGHFPMQETPVSLGSSIERFLLAQ
jgi:pimeloyl-ACP methyl ester carboxylesterase